MSSSEPEPSDLEGPPDEWLSTGEAARRLGFTGEAVRSMCERGRLGALRVGPSGHWRIPAREVEALIASSRPHKRRRG